MSFDEYVKPSDNQQPAALRQAGDLALKVADEFIQSAWHTAVTEKAQGLGQLAGMKNLVKEQSPEPLTGAVNLAHIAGSTTGEILDFVIASKLVGKGINRSANLTIRMAESESLFARSAFGQKAISAAALIKESELSRELLTAGTTGALFGGVFKPVKEGESGYQRIGNSITEASTFMALSGMAGKYRHSFSEDLAGRIKLNALSGAAAGVVSTNMEALTHGRVASVEDTLMNSAGWAIGNVIAAEGMHAVGKSWDNSRKLEAIKELNVKGHREAPLLNMLSMREIADRGDMALLDAQLKAYQPKLEHAFPLEGEIESIPTYRDYLTDKERNMGDGTIIRADHWWSAVSSSRCRISLYQQGRVVRTHLGTGYRERQGPGNRSF